MYGYFFLELNHSFFIRFGETLPLYVECGAGKKEESE